MQFSGAILLLCLAGFVFGQADEFTNVVQMLNNEGNYQPWLNCLTNKGSCSPDSQKIKDILKSGCAQCSDNQRAGMRKVIEFFISKKPADFKQLVALYDADGTYKQKYADLAKKYGITI